MEKRCSVCQEIFEAKREWQAYCSPICRDRASRFRNKASRLEYKKKWDRRKRYEKLSLTV